MTTQGGGCYGPVSASAALYKRKSKQQRSLDTTWL